MHQVGPPVPPASRFSLGGGDWTYARQESTGERICRNHKACSLLLRARLETASQSSYGFASEDQIIWLRWYVLRTNPS